MSKALQQFIACFRVFYESELTPRSFSRCESEVDEWYQEFQSDLFDTRYGYSKGRVRKSADLEDSLTKIAEKHLEHPVRRTAQPTLCLTHDIDYLKPTFQMKAKRLLGYRSLKGESANYLSSIQSLLDIDSKIAGRKGVSTVFVASKCKSSSLKKRWIQWVIDPGYDDRDPLFNPLVDLLNEYECEVGLHGSFYSIEEGLLEKERLQLSQKLRTQVKVGRQHWLHLPSPEPFKCLYESGIQIDSTLGWNGDFGFRGGLSRPFPIVLENGSYLWEVPLVIMDGPLFLDLKLNTGQVIEHVMETLTEVFDRKGCVALDWHDRAATPEYGWFEAYQRVLEWAKRKGFNFSTVSEAVHGRNTKFPT